MVALHSPRNDRMTYYKIRSKNVHTTTVRFTVRLSPGSPVLNIGQIIAALQSLGMVAIAGELPKTPQGKWPTTLASEGAGVQGLGHLMCRGWRGLYGQELLSLFFICFWADPCRLACCFHFF